MKIKQYDFNELGRSELLKSKYGKDWPVVYLINNDSDIYIGETGHAYNRFGQHLKNPLRKDLKSFSCVFDDEFNKSSVLDIEQSLIQLCNSDGKYNIQNLNAGQSEKHNYYQREMYLGKLDEIWRILRRRNLADHDYLWLKNTDMYKYSPYSSLTPEQNEACYGIIREVIECLNRNEKGISIVHGGAGTGKTIVAINTIFNMVNAKKIDVAIEENEGITDEQSVLKELKEYIDKNGDLRIAFVLPMTSIRNTIKAVFKSTQNGLSANMVMGPSEMAKDEYDVVFVDEAHRLSQRKNITSYSSFDTTCNNLGMDKTSSTQLDWIIKQSRYQVLFYDEKQTVKGSDITKEQFDNAVNKIERRADFSLETQMRCLGGSSYTSYVEEILNCSCDAKREMENYDFRIYDDVQKMVDSIKEKDNQLDLCRVAAGYSWKWISKGLKSVEEVKKAGLEDIEIDGHKYVWNMNGSQWIIGENAINEIGCVHTTQGYDLNYVGVILGKEIDYDPINDEIVIDRDKFFDVKVKSGVDDKKLKEYIVNAYKVMMTRGIKGCYVYACNKSLRDYLSKYVEYLL